MPKRNLSIMGREGGVSRVAPSLRVDLPRKLPPETIAREVASPEDLALQKEEPEGGKLILNRDKRRVVSCSPSMSSLR